MAKTARRVDDDLLRKSVLKVEDKGPLRNLNILFKDVASAYNAARNESLPEITLSIVRLRIKEWAIDVKTKAGRRGGKLTAERKAKMQAARGTLRPRSEKFAASKEMQESFEAMRAMLDHNEANRCLSLVDRIEKGSKSAGVQLFCLQCMGFVVKEVRNCGSLECPLYPFRPYQGKEEEGELPEEVKEEPAVT